MKDNYLNTQYLDQKFHSWKSRYIFKLRKKPLINEIHQPRKKLAEAIDRRENGDFWDFFEEFWQKVNCSLLILKNQLKHWTQRGRFHHKRSKHKHVKFLISKTGHLTHGRPLGQVLYILGGLFFAKSTFFLRYLFFHPFLFNFAWEIDCNHPFFDIFSKHLTFWPNIDKILGNLKKFTILNRSMASANFFLGWFFSLIKGLFWSLKIYLLFPEWNFSSRYYILT